MATLTISLSDEEMRRLEALGKIEKTNNINGLILRRFPRFFFGNKDLNGFYTFY
jgi:hypothetical protein